MVLMDWMRMTRSEGESLEYDDTGWSEPESDRIQACDMCRKKKIKCDGRLPKCGHCTNYKTECVFTQVEKKRNPPKG
jgi:Fungal Zn(2)-Cys(6) binuclear cluster domain